MCRKAGCSIARPLLRFNIDGANIDVLRSTKLNTASNREDTEGISEGMRMNTRLIFKPAYSAEHLRISANTVPT